MVVDKHTKLFVWMATGFVVAAAACHLFVTLVLYPTAIYWMTYYVPPNYEFGSCAADSAVRSSICCPTPTTSLPRTR